MKSTGMNISEMIFEGNNPSFCEFQRRCADYYRTHAPEKNYEEELADDLEKGDLIDQKNEESYEEKLYYNFQTMKEIPSNAFLIYLIFSLKTFYFFQKKRDF